MGTIISRERKDGSIGHTAQIRIKRGGAVVYTEAKTFDRRPAAAAWLKNRERELKEPDALETAAKEDPLLTDVIDRYIRESRKKLGETKEGVLKVIQGHSIGKMRCSAITSPALVQFAKSRTGVTPQTVGNYMSHLAAIFTIGRPAWGVPLDKMAMADARAVCKRLGLTGRSRRRERRPTFEEMDSIMTHFGTIRSKRVDSNPMQAICAFAMFSTRRLEEICRITWTDLDEGGSRVLVRDLKHPGEKIGNDIWCDLPPEALRVVLAQPRGGKRIFSVNGDSVSAAFTRACSFLEIEDLHFHDLRHEGISRLFEMGWNIPHVAAVSAHRSWNSLKRYTHIRQVGDKWLGWKWLDVIAPQPQS